ncbi:hypothetical protein Godav_008624, partial [Gossypium davidsonii]|nr:hypothetical protein [Gossypium davidsonii]
VSVITPSTFTVLADGRKLAKFAHWITASGNFKSTAIRIFASMKLKRGHRQQKSSVQFPECN